MKLVIDCFKLVKGAGKSIGIYNLACHLVQELAKGNHRTENEIIVFGNAYNRPDFGVKGIHFIEIKKNPLDKKSLCSMGTFSGFSVSKETRRG